MKHPQFSRWNRFKFLQLKLQIGSLIPDFRMVTPDFQKRRVRAKTPTAKDTPAFKCNKWLQHHESKWHIPQIITNIVLFLDPPLAFWTLCPLMSRDAASSLNPLLRMWATISRRSCAWWTIEGRRDGTVTCFLFFLSTWGSWHVEIRCCTWGCCLLSLLN